jgi:hypothetical protein
MPCPFGFTAEIAPDGPDVHKDVKKKQSGNDGVKCPVRRLHSWMVMIPGAMCGEHLTVAIPILQASMNHSALICQVVGDV